MNKSVHDKRIAYLALANEADCELCCFCKFVQFEGNGSVCYGYSYPECHHKLAYWLPGADDMYPGNDCWGFRPDEPIDVVADIVGIIIQNHNAGVSWLKREDGTYSVFVAEMK